MTRKEAADVLKNIIVNPGRTNGKVIFANAINKAIEVLEEQTEQPDHNAEVSKKGGMISGRNAIRWIKTECNPYGKPTLEYETSCRIMEHLDRMPSAQPELIEKKAYIRGFEQGRTQGMIDTKAEEVTQPECPEQPESAREYCAECDHVEICRWYPYEGCEFRSLPSAQLPRMSDDDINTIRIHLSALYESLCNQRRYREAKEYDGLIARFLTFAQDRPEPVKWLRDEFGSLCGACGSYAYRDKFGKPWESDFCPNCGARMLKKGDMK